MQKLVSINHHDYKTDGIRMLAKKCQRSRGVCRKFATRPKDLPLTKNLHFCSDQADIQPIYLPIR